MQDLLVCLETMSGVPVQDIGLFFHSDGPATQFDIGEKNSCVGCGAESSRFDDLAYCLNHHLLRHEFVLKGDMWKKQKGKCMCTKCVTF